MIINLILMLITTFSITYAPIIAVCVGLFMTTLTTLVYLTYKNSTYATLLAFGLFLQRAIVYFAGMGLYLIIVLVISVEG